MKEIKFKSEEIVPSLALVSSIINSKNALPILDDVRIETKDDGKGGSFVVFMASDSETWVQIKANTIAAESNVVLCIHAKSLLQALRNLEDCEVTMAVDEEKRMVTFNYGNGHFKLPYEDANEFPMPNPAGGGDTQNEIIMSATKLRRAIEKAAFATANDELRPVMCGVRFEFFNDGMVSVASDGHKLAKFKDLTIKLDAPWRLFGFTMQQKPSHTLLNVLASIQNEDVKVMFNDRCFVVSNRSFKITSRLIDGRYPNYDAVIPKDNDKIVIVNKSAFVSAMKRVLPMGNQASELVSLEIKNGVIVLSAEDIDFSKSASERVTCDYQGDNITIGFKGSTLLQLLQNITGENVVLELKDSTRAGVLREQESNDEYVYTSLIMPMLVA